MARIQALIQSLGGSIRGLSISAGALSGVVFICAVTPLRLMLGTNHEVDTALVLTAALCCWLLRNVAISSTSSGSWKSWGLACAAGWTLLLPNMLAVMLKLAGKIPLDSLEWPILAYGTIFGMTLISLLPVFLAIRISHLQTGTAGTSSQWQWLFGLGGACLLLPTLVLPFIGTTVLAWIGIILSGGWGVLSIKLPSNLQATSQIDAIGDKKNGGWISSLVALATGAALALTAFIAGQLIPRNLTADMTLLAGLVVGMGFALARRSWRTTAGIGISFSVVCLFLAAWTGILAAGYPLWTLFCLRINAWVDNVGLLFALRMGLLMLLALPAGFLIRRLAGRNETATASPVIPLLIAAGFVAAPWLPCSPRTVAAGLVIAAMCLTLLAWAQENFRLPHRLWQWVGTAGLACLACGGLLYSGNLDPRNSERILFSSFSLQSFRQGIPSKQLNWIDDTRQLADFTSLSDRFSLWKQRGSQVIMRENGLVMGLHSANAGICPHNAGDLLPVLLPLALHPDPENVLVLGIHPPTLLTCHAWPLRSVRSVDGSAQVHRMLNWLITQPVGGLALQNGPDFRFSHVDPILSLYGQHAIQYDLITCPISHPLSATATSRMTREFYAQVRSHLSEDGIFSQRIPYYDLGPGVIQELTVTLQHVFGDVLAVESVPGELIFLCGAKNLPAIDEGFVERLKAPQVRTLLGQAGWDWSLILGRGGLDNAGLKKFCATKHHINSCGNSPLAFWLPVEVSRWGRKGDATRASLAQQGNALRTSLGESAGGKEVTERLEDLNLAHEIQRDHPNDPWAYRAALKSRLQDRPRATIMQVNHQLKRVMDPEDQRRKDYLVALGSTAKNLNPSPRAIAELAAFESPFDPLVSLFVYFETANILERCYPQSEEQLHHLLHTVYFSSGYDQSVRNVSEALLMVSGNPGIASNEQARWDEMNGLMQTLAQRWQLRLNSNKVSKYEIADTEQSLTAIESAMKELEKHHQAAGLSDAEWASRKLTLEQALVRPLRQHRSQCAREIPLAPVVVKDRG